MRAATLFMKPKRSFSHSLAYVVATGALSGKSPVLPGTVGTLCALALAFLLRQSFPWFSTIPGATALAVVTSLIGFYSIDLLFKKKEYSSESKDPQEIVIDEFAGFFLTILAAGNNPLNLLYCFFIFRVFDMSKPPPLKRIEKAPGAWGIMFDDLGAGLYALIAFLSLQVLL